MDTTMFQSTHIYREIKGTCDLLGLCNNFKSYPSLEKQTIAAGEWYIDQNYYKPHNPNGIELYPKKQNKITKKTVKCPWEGVEADFNELR
jgi:hypothetical protein